MDKIEKIRQEIERCIKRENEILWNTRKRGAYPSLSCEYNLLTLTSLLDFVNTISKEPTCLDDGGMPNKQKCGDCTIACSVMVEEEPDKDLKVRKEKIEDHINELNNKYLGGVYSSYDMAKAYAEGNINGQKWQKEQDEKEQADLFTIVALDAAQRAKEQLMKEAVEAVVTTNLANRPIIYLDQLQGFQYGDKVKVIVIKKD